MIERPVAVRALLAALLLAAPASAPLAADATFSRDAAPIFFRHCVTCHRPGDIAPFSLLSYADARPWARAIARAVRTRAMPPWKPQAGYGEFAGARRLTEEEIARIEAWVEGGAVEGLPSDLPPAPPLAEGWRLGTPDLVVAMEQPYRLAPGGRDELRSFVIRVPLDRTRHVRALEFRPGNAKGVHHANIRVDRSGRARALAAASGGSGFDGRLIAGSFPDGHFLGWTPGQLPPPLDDRLAWPLAPGSDLVVQLHLQPGIGPEEVRASVGLFFADVPSGPPPVVPVMLRLGRQNLDLPAGAVRHSSDDHYTLPVDVALLAVQPHAHFRAREVRGRAALPGGGTRWLLYIDDWDFNWQDLYRYAEPIELPRGTVLSSEFIYDNSAGNRRNPDAKPRRVRWGQDSRDEMGDLWLQVLPRTEADRRRLLADLAPKVLAEDAIGYETLLDAEPDNARLHEAVAAIRLALGEVDRAVDHLRTALRLTPASAEANYNLATALLRTGQRQEAESRLRRALETDPDHVAAHVNLAVLLRGRSQSADAEAHLVRALTLDPDNAAAHTNLGGLRAGQGRTPEAVTHYRRALAANPDLIEALTGLAWLLATTPGPNGGGPAESIGLAERAARLTDDRSVRALDTLAAAYAAAGRFEAAVATIRRALDLAAANGSRDDLALLRERLRLYQQRTTAAAGAAFRP